MDTLTRRGAMGLGFLTGSAFLATIAHSESDDAKSVIVADEKAVLFKIKNVTLDRVDQPGRTISASFGDNDRPFRLRDLPLAEEISIRVSLVEPGSINNVSFDWDRLKGLVGHRVSMLLLAESGRLSVDCIAVAND